MKPQPFKQGKKIEKHFIDSLIAYNSDVSFVRKATTEEDIEKHFDIVFKNNLTNKNFYVDTKSPSKYGDEYFWVEDRAVYQPNDFGKERLGSLHGNADWMAWEMSDHFLLARRAYLLSLMNTKVDKSNLILEISASRNPNKYLYKYRGRIRQNGEERGDRCSLFKVCDLDKKHYRKIPTLKSKSINFINELF